MCLSMFPSHSKSLSQKHTYTHKHKYTCTHTNTLTYTQAQIHMHIHMHTHNTHTQTHFETIRFFTVGLPHKKREKEQDDEEETPYSTTKTVITTLYSPHRYIRQWFSTFFDSRYPSFVVEQFGSTPCNNLTVNRRQVQKLAAHLKLFTVPNGSATPWLRTTGIHTHIYRCICCICGNMDFR